MVQKIYPFGGVADAADLVAAAPLGETLGYTIAVSSAAALMGAAAEASATGHGANALLVVLTWGISSGLSVLGIVVVAGLSLLGRRPVVERPAC